MNPGLITMLELRLNWTLKKASLILRRVLNLFQPE
jgi:hypothetical protein